MTRPSRYSFLLDNTKSRGFSECAGLASFSGGSCPGRGGGGTPIHYLYGRAAQRGRDFEAPDLERGIHFRGVF